MLKDLRHAIRVLLHAKGWTIVVLLSLALGIGANTALFTALNGLLLKDIPVRDPESLVRLRWHGKNDMVTSSSDYGFLRRGPGNEPVRSTFSYPMFQQFVADNRTMSDLLACAPYGRVNVVVDGQAEIATAFISTGNYYRMLGVGARLGRTILPEDDKPGAAPVAMISSKYWHGRFATDPQVVGRTIRVNNVVVEIVGVISPDFTGIQQPLAELPDVSFPLALDSQLNASAGPPRLRQHTHWWLQVVGRLKPGTTIAQVQGNLEGVFQHTARAGLASFMQSLTDEQRNTTSNRNRKEVPRLRVESASRGLYDVNTNELRSTTILTIVVALVLLIVCANVANLLLSRATARQKELSVRLSLGATRWRLVRQLLTESLLLAAMGGGLGILVAYWGRQLLPGAAAQAPIVDVRVLAFILGVTFLTGVLFGIAPALRATSGDIGSALKQTGRTFVSSRSLLGKSLLVVQVTISVVLLVGAGLFLRTVHNLRHVDVGFNPENVLLFRVSPQLNRYDEKRALALYQSLLERVAAVPGVRAAALVNPGLLVGGSTITSFYIRGRTYAQGENSDIHRLVVSPNFFPTMEIPVVLGRGFTDADHATAPKVALINEAAVKKFFPNENPIGQRFGGSVETSGLIEIVGVLRDVKYSSLRDPAPPTMYTPYTQARAGQAMIAVRTAAPPAGVTNSIREAVRQIDSNLPMMDVSTQIEQIERRFAQEKMFAQAYTLFGGLAVLIAAIGLFGLMSYSVSRRTNEIGIRMALGAQRHDVLRLVMRESMILVVVGIVAGTAISLGARRLVETWLFGLGQTDVLTLAGAVTVMGLVSALAGVLPARRASRVDPMVALRYD